MLLPGQGQSQLADVALRLLWGRDIPGKGGASIYRCSVFSSSLNTYRQSLHVTTFQAFKLCVLKGRGRRLASGKPPTWIETSAPTH